jgi:hypothetical protein
MKEGVHFELGTLKELITPLVSFAIIINIGNDEANVDLKGREK